MNTELTKGLLTLFLLTNLPVIANANTFGFGEPSGFSGRGCPANSVKVTRAGSSNLRNRKPVTTIDLSFSAYRLNGRALSNCNFTIPIRVPRGSQISGVTVVWQGYWKKTAELSRRYNSQGNWFKKNLATIDTDKPVNFVVRDNVTLPVRKPCGVSTALRVQSRIKSFKSSSSISVAPQLKFRASRFSSGALSSSSQLRPVRFQLHLKACRQEAAQ